MNMLLLEDVFIICLVTLVVALAIFTAMLCLRFRDERREFIKSLTLLRVESANLARKTNDKGQKAKLAEAVTRSHLQKTFRIGRNAVALANEALRKLSDRDPAE